MISNQNHVENDFLKKSKSHKASKIVTKYVPCLLVFIVIRTDLLLASTVSRRYVTEPISSRSSNELSTAEQSFNCCRRRQRCVVSHEDCLDSLGNDQICHTLISIFYYVKSAKQSPENWFENKIKVTCHKKISNQNHNSKNDFKSWFQIIWFQIWPNAV